MSVVSFGITAAWIAGGIGLVVASITAPVPMMIGLGVIEIMTIIYAAKGNPLDEVEMRAIKRKNGRLIEKLSRYGVIPETSLIETKNATFQLNMKSGTIKTGYFSSTDIKTLTNDQLIAFSNETDAETKSLITAYLKFRDAQATAT
jgi:hypothetical protein